MAASVNHDRLIDSAVARWKGWKPSVAAPSPRSQLKDHELQAGTGFYGKTPTHTADFHEAAAVLAGSRGAAVVSPDFFAAHPVNQRLQARLLQAGHQIRPVAGGVAIVRGLKAKYSRQRLGEIVRFAREKMAVAELHPELRFTRLGAILREHATAEDTVGQLSRAVLSSPHDHPLELEPLRQLEDVMQENPDHPLAGRFNWPGLSEKVRLDQFIHSRYPLPAEAEEAMSHPNIRHLDSLKVHTPRLISRSPEHVKFREEVYSQFPWATVKDIADSATRLKRRTRINDPEDPITHEEITDDAAENSYWNGPLLPEFHSYPERYARQPRPRSADFLAALHRVRSAQQQTLRDLAPAVARRVGLRAAHVRDAILDLPHSATAQTAHVLHHNGDLNRVRLAASWYGLLSQAPSIAVFHVGDGPDSVHAVEVNGSGEKVRQSLDRHGIHERTLLPTKSGWRVMVLDRGSKLGGRLSAFAGNHGSQVKTVRGHGEVIGQSPDSTADGETRRDYRSLIAQLEQPPEADDRAR